MGGCLHCNGLRVEVVLEGGFGEPPFPPFYQLALVQPYAKALECLKNGTHKCLATGTGK